MPSARLILRPNTSVTEQLSPSGNQTNLQNAIGGIDDVEFNSTGTLNQFDLFGAEDLPHVADYILQVDVYFRAANLTGGTAKVKPLWKLDANQVDGAEVTLTASWANYSQLDISCPDGDIWTPTKVNSTQIGYKLSTVSGGGNLDIHTTYFNVWYSYPSVVQRGYMMNRRRRLFRIYLDDKKKQIGL